MSTEEEAAPVVPAPGGSGAPSPTPVTADCPRAREVLALFVGGGIEVEDERWLRAHLTSCGTCRDAYRESVKSAAILGRARRRNRIEEVRLRRRDAMRSRALAVGEKASRGRFMGLRVVALLTLVIVVFTWLNPSFNRPEFAVEWESGEVRAGGKLLRDLEPDGVLAMGDWCVTESASSARVDTGQSEFWLGHRTEILVEDPKRARVRLQRGTLDVSGTSVISCQFGIARLENGRARIDITRGALEIECRSGTVEWVHPGGSQTLAAGDRAEARIPGELLSVR